MTLKTKSDSWIKIDNTLAWTTHKKPFYETYYLKINHPCGDWALWLQYSLYTLPQKPSGVAEILATFTDKAGKKIMVKEIFDLEEYDIVHSHQLIAVGNSWLSLAEAVGSARENKQSIHWELCFEDPVICARLFPRESLYTLPLLKTKFVQPRMLGFVSGNIYINGFKLELKRFRIHQGHAYGPKPVKNSAWANCIDFDEDSEAFFEMLSTKSDLWLKFPLTLILIGMDGHIFHTQSLKNILWGLKSHRNEHSWEFSFSQSGYKFDGIITRESQNTNRLSGFHYQSTMANVSIKVHKKDGGRWKYYKSLTATGKCAFNTIQGQ